jgi:L-arabinokinase
VPAPTVVFYISGHGFGHASREVEIVNALGSLDPSLEILIRSAVSPELLARTLKVPYRLHAIECDSGIVQSTSVTHDDHATVRQAESFYSTFRQRIADEIEQLTHADVRLIVGDIPPLAFEVAGRLGVPSVAIGNFTWDWIYETQPGFDRIDGLLPLIRTAYAKATTALELPFGAGFGVFPSVRRMPLVARRATRHRADTREHFGVPPDRPAALLSFGGYGLPSLDLASIDCLDRWTIVTTDRITSRTGALAPNVVFLAEEAFLGGSFRYEDLVASSDAVVTKPGYGIVAECIASNTPMLYTSRGAFREYDLFVRDMPKYLRCRFISNEDLFAGRWRASLEALLAQPAAPERIATNGADVAANVLLEMAHAH